MIVYSIYCGGAISIVIPIVESVIETVGHAFPALAYR
jgi:hypothetical protein